MQVVQGDLGQEEGERLLPGTDRVGLGRGLRSGGRSRRLEPLPALVHPTGHPLGQPQGQAQRRGGQAPRALQDITAQTFVALGPGRRGTAQAVGPYFWRPLFALGFKAFSRVRGCTLT